VEWFDLQLSGHTHGGQIFPFNWLTRLAYPAGTGLSKVGDHTWLYVSRGTGTWGPPIRFLAPSELTVIELRGE
jgi:predicted MPP superfamily phosphohydrolase